MHIADGVLLQTSRTNVLLLLLSYHSLLVFFSRLDYLATEGMVFDDQLPPCQLICQVVPL